MLLAIDIGNSHTHMGVFEERKLIHEWRIVSNKQSTADELRITLCALLREAGLEKSDVYDVMLVSVVPALTMAWKKGIFNLFGKDPFVCTSKSLEKLFLNAYPHPEEVGGDLVVDAIAAKHRFGAPVIIVDFGTATTIEVIDKRGYFLGGIIMPGMEVSARALSIQATMLPVFDFDPPRSIMGSTTQECMQAGLVYGEADRADGIVRRVFTHLGYKAPVVACGGLAPLVAPYSNTIDELVGDLTLGGLEIVHHELISGKE